MLSLARSGNSMSRSLFFFTERVIVLRMHGERENPRLAGENIGRSVALMDVEVNDKHLFRVSVI